MPNHRHPKQQRVLKIRSLAAERSEIIGLPEIKEIV
jgi:hypothetical protein